MLEPPRILILARDPEAARRYECALHGIGYEIATVSSAEDVTRHFDWRRFSAIVVANSFHEPERAFTELADILQCPVQALISSQN